MPATDLTEWRRNGWSTSSRSLTCAVSSFGSWQYQQQQQPKLFRYIIKLSTEDNCTNDDVPLAFRAPPPRYTSWTRTGSHGTRSRFCHQSLAAMAWYNSWGRIVSIYRYRRKEGLLAGSRPGILEDTAVGDNGGIRLPPARVSGDKGTAVAAVAAGKGGNGSNV